MKITYDKKANSAYLYVKNKIAKGEVKQTLALNDELILDFDAKKKLIGIEILNAVKLIPADVLKVAVAE